MRTTYVEGVKGYLSYKELAERTGLPVATLRRYKRRGDLVEPDEYVGRSPVWKEATIEAWLTSRRGHSWRKGATG